MKNFEIIAAAIKAQRELCLQQKKTMGDQALTALAYTLSNHLPVDKYAFLRACGVRP